MENKQVIMQENNELCLLSEQMKLSEIISKSGLVPKALDTKEKVFVALQWGRELGLSPMVAITNIAVVNGKPSLSSDIMYAIVRNNPEYAGCKWIKQNEKEAEVIIKRRNAGIIEEFRGYFSIDMAKTAGLNDKDTWKKYPGRMLKHRAQSFALRDAFPDILSGLYNADEISSDEFYELAETDSINGKQQQNSPKQDLLEENILPEPTPSTEQQEELTNKFYINETKCLLLKAKEVSELLPKNLYSFYKEKIEMLKLIKESKDRFEATKNLVELIQKDAQKATDQDSSNEMNELEIF